MSPGVDKSKQQAGTFGGIIDLYKRENMINAGWTTEENDNLRMTFIIPCCLAYSGPDTFVDREGIPGPLEYDIEIGLPYVLSGVTKGYFTPLVIGR